MYKDMDKSQYLTQTFRQVVDYHEHESISNSDHEEINALTWVQTTTEGLDGLDDFIRICNELARKFLLEGKWKSCKYLLKNFMPSRLSQI